MNEKVYELIFYLGLLIFLPVLPEFINPEASFILISLGIDRYIVLMAGFLLVWYRIKHKIATPYYLDIFILISGMASTFFFFRELLSH